MIDRRDAEPAEPGGCGRMISWYIGTKTTRSSFVHALQRYVAHLGKADRYDELLTMTYVELIRRRMCERGDAGGWAAFARANQDLLAARARLMP